MKNSNTEYGSLSKALHWLMAVLIIVLIAVGLYMADLPDETEAQKQYAFQFITLHKSFGVAAMLLIIFRLAWVRISPAPALPAVFSNKEQLLVKGVKAALYLLMVLLPVSGYIMSNAAGYPVHLFGLGELPALVGKSRDLGRFAHEAHEIMGNLMVLLILVHVAGALKHRLKEKGGESDILQRML